MELIQAVILGIVQGITEWFPVSSSAHLAIFNQIFQVEAGLFFYVLLHLATLLSVAIYFRGRIIEYFFSKQSSMIITKKGLYVVIATIPIVIAGFLFHDLVEKMFTNFFFMGIALIINSGLLFFTRFMKGRRDVGFVNTFFVGLMQIFALVPGISRVGVTVSAGLYSGIKKGELILFSMMLSLPAIFGAFIYELFQSKIVFDASMIVGFIVTVVVGYFALGFLVKRIQKGEFYKYWLYCLILGIILLFN